MSFRTVTPAYGRDYQSAKVAQLDWANGRDFILQPDGRYINKEDADKARMTIIIRYNGFRRTTYAEK